MYFDPCIVSSEIDKMQTADLEVIKEIPGYKVILKAVLKTQIQQLVRFC